LLIGFLGLIKYINNILERIVFSTGMIFIIILINDVDGKAFERKYQQ
jgi:hypothetical protein